MGAGVYTLLVLPRVSNAAMKGGFFNQTGVGLPARDATELWRWVACSVADGVKALKLPLQSPVYIWYKNRTVKPFIVWS